MILTKGKRAHSSKLLHASWCTTSIKCCSRCCILRSIIRNRKKLTSGTERKFLTKTLTHIASTLCFLLNILWEIGYSIRLPYIYAFFVITKRLTCTRRIVTLIWDIYSFHLNIAHLFVKYMLPNMQALFRCVWIFVLLLDFWFFLFFLYNYFLGI